MILQHIRLLMNRETQRVAPVGESSGDTRAGPRALREKRTSC